MSQSDQAQAGPSSNALGKLRKAYGDLNAKHLVTFLNTLILVVAEWVYGGLGGYDRLFVSLGSCMATELVLSWFVLGHLPKSYLSPYISGVSLSLLLKPVHGLLWPFAIGGFLAIASKYVLRYRGRHLWNPTNFSICVLLIAAAPVLTKLTHEWGNDLSANLVIWSVGLLVIHRARLLHVTVSYVVAYFAFSALRAGMSAETRFWTEIGPITGPMYQLFVFFMITDPPTVVRTWRGRVLVAVLIAGVEHAIRFGLDRDTVWLQSFAVAPALFALCIVGPLAKSVDLWRAAREAR